MHAIHHLICCVSVLVTLRWTRLSRPDPERLCGCTRSPIVFFLSRLFSIIRVGSDCEVTLLSNVFFDSCSRFFCFMSVHLFLWRQCEAIASFAHALSFSVRLF